MWFKPITIFAMHTSNVKKRLRLWYPIAERRVRSTSFAAYSCTRMNSEFHAKVVHAFFCKNLTDYGRLWPRCYMWKDNSVVFCKVDSFKVLRNAHLNPSHSITLHLQDFFARIGPRRAAAWMRNNCFIQLLHYYHYNLSFEAQNNSRLCSVHITLHESFFLLQKNILELQTG
jgi:hypothetical protein